MAWYNYQSDFRKDGKIFFFFNNTGNILFLIEYNNAVFNGLGSLCECIVFLRMKRASSLNFLNKSTEETTQVRLFYSCIPHTCHSAIFLPVYVVQQ